jgi:hypothetical protein
MYSYYRKIKRQVDYIFENFPEAADNAQDYIRCYERQFRRFPFWYARANTEFGNHFGRKLSPEDAGWGQFRPIDEELSLEEMIEKAEKLAEDAP